MSGAAVRGFAAGLGAGSMMVFWPYRHHIMNPDHKVQSLLEEQKVNAARQALEVRMMQEREQQAWIDMRRAVSLHGQGQRAQAKEDLRKAVHRLRQASHNYKQAVESGRSRKMAKVGTKVLMNVLTSGVAEGVSTVVDVAEMALDVADAAYNGSKTGIVTALVDGVAGVADAAGRSKHVSAGIGDKAAANADFGELVVDLIDIGEKCATDVDDPSKRLEKIHTAQENLIHIEQSTLQGALREEGTELLRAIADLLVLLEHLKAVSSAEATFYKLLEREGSKA